jgi:hypothetical protein
MMAVTITVNNRVFGDLESILPFLVIGFLYMFIGPKGKLLAINLYRVYAVRSVDHFSAGTHDFFLVWFSDIALRYMIHFMRQIWFKLFRSYLSLSDEQEWVNDKYLEYIQQAFPQQLWFSTIGDWNTKWN